MFATTIFMVTLFQRALASVGEGGACSSLKNHLDPLNHRFISNCDDLTYCSDSVNGTCLKRGCRRDEFPFGYSNTDPFLPPLCSAGTFCPDEGDSCKPLVGVGGPCQLNRDEQCAPPPDWEDLAGPQNFNGSVCLHFQCMCVTFLPIHFLF
jgi:hypothetical protein